jgi:Skp family chaperone for outer membrane proteins
MNKLMSRTILAIALAGFCAVTAQGQTRIATVDVKKIITGYWKTKEATAALKDRREDLLKELKGLSDDIKKADDEYKKLIDDANDQAVSAEERDKRKKSAEGKLKSISEMKDRAREFDRNASATLNEQAQRMSERIEEKIRAAVSAKAKTAGYGMVVDSSARSMDNKMVVVYSSDDNDLTSSILEQLNSDAPSEASKVPEKTEKKEDKK